MISGFLISNIIFQNICQNSFSFVVFYCRRVRRIFPALLVIFVCCYALGWFILLPHEYKQLGKHIASGAGFISNFVLWSEAGYFDNTAITKPLLHLWSLGIEEQFYIVWPLIVWAAYKKKIDWLHAVSVIAIGSFVLNLWLVDNDLTAAFYSPFTRIWELLLGALLAHRRCADCVERLSTQSKAVIAGLSVCELVLGVVLINKETHFPGVWALLPTLATAGLIAVGPSALVNRIVLSNRLLVLCGLISFPLYLWHWPLLSFARIIEAEPLSTKTCWVIVVVSVLLAWATYVLVEKPLRYGTRGALKVVTLLVAMLAIGYGGFNVYDRDGLEFRGPQIVGKDRGYDGGPGGTMLPRCGLPPAVSAGFTCWEDARPTIRFALVGDSKASAIHGGLVRTSTGAGRWLFIGMGSKDKPLPIISSDPVYAEYQAGSVIALKALAENKQIQVVLIVTSTRALFRLKNTTDIEDLEGSPNYQIALEGLQRTVDVLKNAQKKIVFLIDNPTLPHPEDCLPRTMSSEVLNRLLKQTLNQRCLLPLDRHLELSRKYRQLLMTLARDNEGAVTLFDSVPFLCDQKDNICKTTKDGRLLYDGTDHISDHAAGLIGQELNRYLSNLGSPR